MSGKVVNIAEFAARRGKPWPLKPLLLMMVDDVAARYRAERERMDNPAAVALAYRPLEWWAARGLLR